MNCIVIKKKNNKRVRNRERKSQQQQNQDTDYNNYNSEYQERDYMDYHDKKESTPENFIVKNIDDLLTKYSRMEAALILEIYHQYGDNLELADFQLKEMMFEMFPTDPKMFQFEDQNYLNSTKSCLTEKSNEGMIELDDLVLDTKKLSTQSDSTSAVQLKNFNHNEVASKDEIINIYKNIMGEIADDEDAEFESEFLAEQSIHDMLLLQLFIQDVSEKMVQQELENNRGINVNNREHFPTLGIDLVQ